MTECRWFYELLMEEFGPVSAEQVTELLNDGTLATSDRVRAEDSEIWLTVEEMQQAEIMKSASPLADLSELSSSIKEYGDAPDRNSLQDEPDIDSFRIEEHSDAPTGTSLRDEPNIDSFNLEGEDDSPIAETDRPGQHVAAAHSTDSRDDDEERFCAEVHGQTLGPMSLRDLIFMADSGTLSATDKIRAGDNGSWQSAESLPELAVAFFNLTNEDIAEPARKTASVANKQARRVKGKEAKKPGTTRRKTRKKKLKIKNEEDLAAEILSEVLNDDGPARTELKPSDQLSTVTDQQADVSDIPSPAAPATPLNQRSLPATETSPPHTHAPPAAQRPAVASRKHAPEKMSRGSGIGVQMPDPKVLGMIGGAALVIGLVAASMMGVVSWSGVPPEVVAELKELQSEYETLSAGATPDDQQWEQFQSRLRDVHADITKSYPESTGGDDDLGLICQCLTDLADTTASNQERRERAMERLATITAKF